MTYRFDSGSMSQTFRPLLRHWIFKLVPPLALVAWAGYLAVYGLFFGSAILLMYAAVIAFANRPPIWQRDLWLDDQGLSARLGRETVRVLWNDVIAAWQVKRGRTSFLNLSSEEVTVGIPLEFFDSRAIWEAIQRRVPLEALEADVEMFEMLHAQIELRPIELRHEERALFTWSHNVAIRRSA